MSFTIRRTIDDQHAQHGGTTSLELTVKPGSEQLVENAGKDNAPDFWVGREVVESPVELSPVPDTTDTSVRFAFLLLLRNYTRLIESVDRATSR